MEDTRRFKRILLATDGSSEAETAVDAAIGLARFGPANVCVLHVWNLEVRSRHGHWVFEPYSEAHSLVQETVDRLISAGVMAGPEIYQADHAHIAEAIASVARETKADLVIVGSRGLSDWQSMFQHSVSHRVMSLVDCPVLVVRGSRDHSAVGKPRRIMVAVAGGDDAERATDAAIAVAQTVSGRALVVHVAQALFGAQGYAYVESREEVEECVDSAVRRLTAARIPTERMVINNRGPVAAELISAAAKWNADLIVIGSSRMRDLTSLLFGSVSHQLLHGADMPVLIAERVK